MSIGERHPVEDFLFEYYPVPSPLTPSCCAGIRDGILDYDPPVMPSSWYANELASHTPLRAT